MNLCILFSLTIFFIILYLSNGSSSTESPAPQETLGLKVPCSYSKVKPGDIRVMTFNLWLSGDRVVDGVEKIAKHINLLDPDVVCLQGGIK